MGCCCTCHQWISLQAIESSKYKNWISCKTRSIIYLGSYRSYYRVEKIVISLCGSWRREGGTKIIIASCWVACFSRHIKKVHSHMNVTCSTKRNSHRSSEAAILRRPQNIRTLLLRRYIPQNQDDILVCIHSLVS